MFKAMVWYSSVPEILGSRSKIVTLYTFSVAKNQMWINIHKRTNNVETRNVSRFPLSKQLHSTNLSASHKYYFSKVCMPVTQEVLIYLNMILDSSS